MTAAGERHFCTGAALGGPRPAGPPRPEDAPDRVMGDAARMIRRGWQRLVASILDCEKPVVGAINGTAAGGGAQLVLACDLVVMADHARLIEVFVRRGIMPERTIEMSSYHAMLGCIVIGMGISLLPRSVLSTFPESRRLSIHALPKGEDRAQTVLFWRKGAASPKINALIELLKGLGGPPPLRRRNKNRC